MGIFSKTLVDSNEYDKMQIEHKTLSDENKMLLDQMLSKTVVDGADMVADNLSVQLNQSILKQATYFTSTTGTARPPIDMPFVSSDSGAKIPVFPFPLHFLYQLAKNVDALRIPIGTIVREIFKNGLGVRSKFNYKCKNCLKEFEAQPLNEKGKEQCDECGSKQIRKPDAKERRKIAVLLKKRLNNNGQKFKYIMKQIERDLEIADSGYLLLLKEYKFNDNGEITGSKLDEIIRLHPPQVFLISDYNGRLGYTDDGKEIFVCPDPMHRELRIFKSEQSVDKGTMRCQQCGCVPIKAWVEVNSTYATNIPNPQRRIYAKGEIIFFAGKYWDSMIYGFSNIYTVWQKAMALSHMDEYIRKYFDKARPPKGLLVIGSRNIQSLQKMFDKMKVEMQKDPYGLTPLMVENERGGKNMVQYVNLTGSLQDLQFIDIRDEFRRTIGALYGVLPLFSGDLPTGWNQEGLEMTVTNRAVQDGQQILKEGFFDPLCEALGVKDYEIFLHEGEETDEMRDEQLKGMKIANAVSMHSMGFKIRLDGNKDFVYENLPEKDADPSEQGTMGGARSTTTPKTEQQTNFQGEKLTNRPSDTGGMAQGHPAAGTGTTLSRKSSKEKKKSKKKGKTYRVTKDKGSDIEVEILDDE